MDFGGDSTLIQLVCLICASWSSGQHFALGFLQIPSHDGHPCLQLMIPLIGLIGNFHPLEICHANRTVGWACRFASAPRHPPFWASSRVCLLASSPAGRVTTLSRPPSARLRYDSTLRYEAIGCSHARIPLSRDSRLGTGPLSRRLAVRFKNLNSSLKFAKQACYHSV